VITATPSNSSRVRAIPSRDDGHRLRFAAIDRYRRGSNRSSFGPGETRDGPTPTATTQIAVKRSPTPCRPALDRSYQSQALVGVRRESAADVRDAEADVVALVAVGEAGRGLRRPVRCVPGDEGELLLERRLTEGICRIPVAG
jgi:hypothetical protein